MGNIPQDHPRYKSLITREKIVEGFERGLVAPQGLIAHGRGEAFDYILGEKSHDFALKAEKAAVELLINSDYPVISVNGNAAALVPQELVKLSKLLKAPLEVNLFHWSQERAQKLADFLQSYEANVLSAGDAVLEGLRSDRRIVDSRGIYEADTVLVPLEDGDRCEILKRHGKKSIAIDLNPLSRTSQMADISIVDNVNRAISNMIEFLENLKTSETMWSGFDNRQNLGEAVEVICNYLNCKVSK
ncbi:MAG: 4-phosphopantoate--beta-alanine ligase [Archaeoglobaceae archaeon]